MAAETSGYQERRGLLSYLGGFLTPRAQAQGGANRHSPHETDSPEGRSRRPRPETLALAPRRAPLALLTTLVSVNQLGRITLRN